MILKLQKENVETLKISKKSLHQGKMLLFSKSRHFLTSEGVQNESRKHPSTLGHFNQRYFKRNKVKEIYQELFEANQEEAEKYGVTDARDLIGNGRDSYESQR